MMATSTRSRGRSSSIFTRKGKESLQFKKTKVITLDPGKRYAHTAENDYFVTMAHLKPDDRRRPNCGCEKPDDQDRVILIVEHNLKEHVLCVLDDKNKQCKLNLFIESGEQVAFRTVGQTPLSLTTIHKDQNFDLDFEDSD